MMIVWQSGVAERFLNKIVAAMNFRLKRAIDNFQKSYRGDENETIKAIMQLRKELQFLLKVVSIKALPDKEKAELRNIIVAQSNSIQESLEKSSESDRSGKLASIVKNNRVKCSVGRIKMSDIKKAKELLKRYSSARIPFYCNRYYGKR